MYVIVEINGQQFKAEEGKKLFVHHIKNAEAQATVEFEKVLLVDNEGTVTVGAPVVEGAKVVCEVVTTCPFSISIFPGVGIPFDSKDVRFVISPFMSMQHCVTGFQINGFFGITTNKMEGLQVSGFGNIALNKVVGLQTSGFVNIANELTGVQSAGFVNVATGNVKGFQTAGFVNVSSGKITGFQSAGFVESLDKPARVAVKITSVSSE